MTAARPSEKVQAHLYLRLLARDPSAPGDFAAEFLPSLLAALHAAFPAEDLPEPALVDDCVLDTLLRFPQQPEKFNRERGSLWTYLYVDAKGDILNALDREKRHQRRQQAALPLVALDVQSRNELQESELWKPLREDGLSEYLPAGIDLNRLRTEVAAILSSEADLSVVELIVADVRETERFSAVLGISHLPLAEQRRLVKKVKDKWKKRLSRLGASLNDT